MKRILLTGASGFVGKRYLVYNTSRYEIVPFSVATAMPGEKLLSTIDTVVHLGGLAHQMQKVDPARYFEANYDNTRDLALRAKQAGVRHFIFISTIKVFGEKQQGVLTLESPCIPENDPYGESKLKAEQFLQTMADADFTVSIIRPPLIYGPGVKGNLDRLLKLADSGMPLPFGAIHNRRTMIYLDNFIALINQVIDTGVGGLFLASDSRPVSTTELVTLIRKFMGKPARLVPVPGVVKKLIRLLRPAAALRLFGSLEMDASHSYKKINFAPPYPIEEGIKAMVDAYLDLSKK